MKKLGLLLLVVLLGTTMSMAQNKGGQRNSDPAEMAKRQTEAVKKACDLDADQETKVQALNLKSANKMNEMRKSGGGDRDAMREKMKTIRDDQNKEMKKVLSDDQWKKYEKYMEEQRKQRGQRGGGGRG